MAEAAAAHARRRGGLVAAALPRHGADRLRVHPAAGTARRSSCCRPTSRTRASGSSWSPGCGATFTVSPDFGYRNCVRNIGDTAGLDLSSPQAGALRRGAGAASAPSRRSSEVRRAEPHHARATAWPRPPWPSPSGRAGRRCASTARASSSRWASRAAGVLRCGSWTADDGEVERRASRARSA